MMCQLRRMVYIEVEYEMDPADALFDRYVDKAPFVPGRKEEREKRCEEILAIQSMGLKKRMEHTHCPQCGDRYLRRFGFYSGTAGGSKSCGSSEPAQNLHYSCDDAMLWNHGPYLQQRMWS